jgi:hypothetical protein
MQHLPNRRDAQGCYDPDELDLFKKVLDEMVADLAPDDDARPDREPIRLTRVRLAMAILHCADRGERDPARLKRLAADLVDAGTPVPPTVSRRGPSPTA